MNTAEKIKELNAKFDTLQPGFERDFIKYNAERVAVHGEAVKFSEKQITIIDRMHKHRIVEGKAFKPAEKVEG